MEPQNVEILGFTFRTSERGGTRVLECIWPEVVPFASLSVVAWRMIELWDEEPDVPTVTISDLTRVGELSDADLDNLGNFTAGIAVKPNASIAAWYAEGNPHIEAALRTMVTRVTGSDRGVFPTRDEALAAIDRALERRAHRTES